MKKNIISLIILVISLALIFFLISPLWSSIKTLKAELIDKKEEISKVEELLSKIQQIQQDYQELEQDAQKIFSALPQEEDFPHLLVQFDTLAVTNGLLLESIVFSQMTQDKKKISGFPSLSVDITLTGSYDAFKRYLAALESSVRSMNTRSIGFGAKSTGEEADILTSLGIFKFDLGIDVYYQ